MMMANMRIAIGSDHARFELKEAVKAFLVAEDHEVLDVGADDRDPWTILRISFALLGLGIRLPPRDDVPAQLRRGSCRRVTQNDTRRVWIQAKYGVAFDASDAREAELLLGALARVKARRFGRLIVTVNDGRVVDVEVIEKIDRNVLRAVSMLSFLKSGPSDCRAIWRADPL
jgi:hypothetical protein